MSATDWSSSNSWTSFRTAAARLNGSEDVRSANSIFPATPPSTPWACGENTCGNRGSVRLWRAASPTTPTTVSQGPFEGSSPIPAVGTSERHGHGGASGLHFRESANPLEQLLEEGRNLGIFVLRRRER